ncbi:MAG: DEAD/DEAH box helicase [Solirubrobacterales bacterium]|nr:DEAD/DEAH box helicase [Solirubrobacterales bacterium]
MANRSHAGARPKKSNGAQHRNTNKPKNPRHGSNNAGRGNKKKSKLIDTDLFINSDVQPAQQIDYIAKHKFVDFGFDERLERNVIARGYETPTQIQDESIKPIMEGRDLIGLANTGTGKTAAFILPIINKLLKTDGKNDVLIVTPTRELAAQIEDDFRAFTKGMKLYSALCVGGTNINPQIKALAKEPHVVIGTPGRLKDLLQQRKLDLDFTDTLVLDEADRMLDMGFIKDVRFLCDAVPAKRQTLCFSATVTREIQGLLDNLLTNPVKCSVRTNTTNDHIHQSIVHAGDKAEKVEQLHDILIKEDVTKAIVFMRTKWSAQKLSDNLVKRGFKSEAIHGNKSQPQRQRALNAFKSDKVNILVATDVAARGLDIPEVSHVINFDEPETHDDYIHRIGRTGRAGLGGNAVTFVEKRR